ncbi:hypothetical protein TTHERM_00826830 (macronuclear) [Tetrahymena thermophila SB210]|uniref:Uncharacterized protein n=1 Tax=Tetrahymena thermophila (strain SB210) TaxID=312017 RepID=Q22EI5_TETTS|nr:hypothetical protein TTHERM_00826830 [Tetrahymena thermophila SB210]EAR83667.2 hypothetical protein TTHERM_00826830 [Tetrahymena thermophila SB210]|eukprot:XP_001031330.2 hypothetical protein TTHERM_00826830 [Tetrahymena thermophila SB210]
MEQMIFSLDKRSSLQETNITEQIIFQTISAPINHQTMSTSKPSRKQISVSSIKFIRQQKLSSLAKQSQYLKVQLKSCRTIKIEVKVEQKKLIKAKQRKELVVFSDLIVYTMLSVTIK